MSASIVHIINPKTRSTNPLVEISLDSRAKLFIDAFLSRGRIVLRRTGTFFLSFDQLMARLGDLNDLLVAREYNADGSVLRVHSLSNVPSGASIASIVRDIDDTILLQYRTFTAQKTENPGVSVIRFGQSAILSIPPLLKPASRAIPEILPEESLIGVRANGELVTEIPGKRIIRIWKR